MEYKLIKSTEEDVKIRIKSLNNERIKEYQQYKIIVTDKCVVGKSLIKKNKSRVARVNSQKR